MTWQERDPVGYGHAQDAGRVPGAATANDATCPECGGTGWIDEPDSAGESTDRVPCPWCTRVDRGPTVNPVRFSDVQRCPIRSLSPAHYRADGSCRCDE